MNPVLLDALLPTLAGLTSLALAVAVLVRRPIRRLQWTFALGMVGFVIESVPVLMLLATEPADRDFWVRALGIVRAALPLPWLIFIISLAQRAPNASFPLWGVSVPAAAALSAVAIDAALTATLQFPATTGLFKGARMLGTGRYGAIAELLLVIGILLGLEACLRTARGQNRVRIKYLVLGLGGIFLVRFYLQSQVLLFHTVVPEYLKISSATLIVANVAMAVAIARDCLRTVELSVSRQVVLRSVVVIVLSLYLFAVGVLGWVLNYLEIPEKFFWGSVAVFVSALTVAGVLLSERLRWRVKRFVELHFYQSKYDYRQQLVAFNRRMASIVTVDEIGPQLLEAISEAVGATRAALYLSAVDGTRYVLAASSRCSPPVPVFDQASRLTARLQTERDPVVLDGDVADRLGVADTMAVLGEGTVAAPLSWRGDLTGFILVGPERTGVPYGPEDLVFMATLGELAAGATATASISEALARARESRAFDHLASVVAHDVKNSVSALSWLTRALLRNFDDPEFQRDSVQTLSRTVDRMKRLLARLASPADASRLQFEAVNLLELVDEATSPLRDHARIRFVRDVQATPSISGDPDALLRVFQNLLTNAVEAIDGEGSVTVSVEARDRMAIVSVSDTGRGMTEEFVSKLLFKPFSTTKDGGWGIGLYQSREVVERHGGSIAVVTREGAGTTFRVVLPVTEDPTVDVRPQLEAAPPAHPV